jgi:hypothetical protein
MFFGMTIAFSLFSEVIKLDRNDLERQVCPMIEDQILNGSSWLADGRI